MALPENGAKGFNIGAPRRIAEDLEFVGNHQGIGGANLSGKKQADGLFVRRDAHFGVDVSLRPVARAQSHVRQRFLRAPPDSFGEIEKFLIGESPVRYEVS